MKTKRLIIILAILTIILVTGSSMAFEISGTIYTGLFQEKDAEDVSDWEGITIGLDKDFGYTAELYLELGLESNQGEDLVTEINQLYLDYYTENIDWRIGRQLVNWGSSYKINPTSYFEKFTGLELTENRQEKGIKGVKAIYYGQNDIEITGVLTPFATDVYEQEYTENQQAIKFTRRAFKGFDISLSYFNGQDRFPLLQNQEYPEVNKIGIDINGSIGDIGIWSELVRSRYDLLDKQTIEGILGSDYKFNNNLQLTGQIYYRQGRTQVEPDLKLLILNARKPILKFHQLEVITIYDLDNEDIILHPVFDYSLAEAVKLSLGGNWVINESENNMLTKSIKEGVYTELVIDF